MIYFFGNPKSTVFVVESSKNITKTSATKLQWLFGNQPKIEAEKIEANFVGPRAAMITPWSTNAVEITQNMGIENILRIEEFRAVDANDTGFDPMISQKYTSLHQEIFKINVTPQPILEIDNIAAYNQKEGLALSDEEVAYLENLAKKLNRKLTDSEVFGFSQVNSEHCRHKIFNGTFVIDGEEMPSSLFKLIKKTSQEHPNDIVSAYKDNVAFVKGPVVQQFAPKSADKPDFYALNPFESVLSLKAETHNFPTTVEPFNGAATGSGGEIRDRLAGGKGSIPLAGTAVYMTAYARLEKDRKWEQAMPERKWLYQTPLDILIKASNGASDFGNKFGQPLISGSLFTFEHDEQNDEMFQQAQQDTKTISSSEVEKSKPRKLGFDKVIMLAGGIGYAKAEQALKGKPEKGDAIVILGGDNYRIGMGGAAVSSADTGEFASGIELNAVQRSNPEMQKRAANAIRAMVESDENLIVSIHDHGAGGHLNCLSELVEDTGGTIEIDKLPIGDPTLSLKEIIGNESQERMGLVIKEENYNKLKAIAERERAPIYKVGKVTDTHQFTFTSEKTNEKPMDLALADMFGSSPKMILQDKSIQITYHQQAYQLSEFENYLAQVLQLEAVACKDWLTNKVDRCVGGKVAKQQCVGQLQLPLNNVGVMALDYLSKEGIATSIGHSPISGLINPEAGSLNSIAEALTNIIWAPLKDGLHSVSLSANWMWPCKNVGEDARLYKAVKAVSDFCIDLGINVPTGKDSLSMKQKYKDEEVLAPGTVIISAIGNCTDITTIVEPVLQNTADNIYYINLSGDAHQLGGSSFNQILNSVGNIAPTITDAAYFKNVFNSIQNLIKEGKITAGHDVASGGLITTLLELCFASTAIGANINLTSIGEKDSIKLLFSENAGIVIQAKKEVEEVFKNQGITYFEIGNATNSGFVNIENFNFKTQLSVSKYRDTWYKTSYLLDSNQTANNLASVRYQEYKNQPLQFRFPSQFDGKLPQIVSKNKPKAAVLREKGSNSERELANALFLAGFDVKDVHMTDLISGRETLEDIQFLGAVGGFSNSDVLGSAKGWAGAIKYNEKAKAVIDHFFKREDTLSIGICNGCQLFMELDLIHPEHDVHGKMQHNLSKKHESAFTSVKIGKNNSVMLSNLEDTTLGVWISHGEGKFWLPKQENEYHIVAKYGYENYPANPNGSDYNTAMLCDKTGRHLVTMPHIERSIFTWNWAHYPTNRTDEVSPWLQAFINAKNWLDKK